MKFGELIKRQREKLKISQQELANRLKIAWGYLNKIERGKMPAPSDDKIRLLSKILKIDVAILFLYAYKEKAPKELQEYFDVMIKPKFLRQIMKRDVKKLSRLEKKAIIEVVDSFKEMLHYG